MNATLYERWHNNHAVQVGKLGVFLKAKIGRTYHSVKLLWGKIKE